jgi:amidase
VCPRFGLVPSPDVVEPSNLAIAERGRAMRAVDLVSALGVRDRISRGFGAFFEKFDLLLTPTLAVTPPAIGELDVNRSGMSGDEVLDRLFEMGPFTPLFNLTGSPAMNVPCHRTYAGLPIGVQFAARFGNEVTLLRLAGQLEQELRWADLKPEVVAG